MFFLYQIISSLLILISPILIIFRIYKGKEDKVRFIEKFSISSKKRSEEVALLPFSTKIKLFGGYNDLESDFGNFKGIAESSSS